MIAKPKFDRMARYRYAAFLFGIMTALLWATFFGIDFPRGFLLYSFMGLTAPALGLMVWNIGQEWLTIYRRRKAIDKMLDEHHH